MSSWEPPPPPENPPPSTQPADESQGQPAPGGEPQFGAPQAPPPPPFGQQPQYGAPQAPPPQYGQQPPYGASQAPQGPPPPPQYGQQPQYGAPQGPPQQYGQPQYGQPQYGQPQYGQPAFGGYPAAPPNPYGGAVPAGPPGAVRPLNVGNRVVAFIIDWALIAVPTFILYLIAAAIFISSSKTTYDDNTGVYRTTGGGGAAIVFLLVVVIGLAAGFYFVYLLGSTGQTPGKKWMGVKVVDATTGQTIGFGRAFLRYIVQGLCNIVCYAGLWSAFLDGGSGRYQGWHDKAVGTQVISVK